MSVSRTFEEVGQVYAAANVVPLPRDISERDFSRTFEDTLHLFRWKAAHFRTAMNARGYHMTPVGADGKGWPDYAVARPGEFFVAELKVRYNKPTVEQAAWIAWLTDAGIEAHVWWPTDWPEIVERLAR